MVRQHKVQYSCRERLGTRQAFTEQIAELPAGARLTGRLRRHVARTVGDGAAVSVACQDVMSWPIAHAAEIDDTAPTFKPKAEHIVRVTDMNPDNHHNMIIKNA